MEYRVSMVVEVTRGVKEKVGWKNRKPGSTSCVLSDSDCTCTSHLKV